MELQFNYVNQILVFIIFASALNILMGYAGQVSVAPAAFGAMGGYAMAYLWTHDHLALIWDLLIGLTLAGLGGLIVGIPALRLTTEWLILLTLAWQTIVVGLLETSSNLGGAYGIDNVTGLRIFGHKLALPTQQFPLVLALGIVTVLICWRIGESPYGRVLRAIREDSLATRSVGKNVFAYKLIIFTVTSALSGVAGVLLVLQGTVASPGTFSFDESTAIIAMVIFGGMGNLLGSAVGATVIVLTGPFFQDVIKLSADYASLWRLAAYGLLLVVVMRLRPQGLLPEGFSLRRLVASKRGRLVPAGGMGVVPAVGSGNGEAQMDGPPVLHAGAPRVVEAKKSGTASLQDRLPILTVRGLSKRFGGIVAVDDLNMELKRGTITALVGPNGAGKTTVFNLLTGAIRPDRGEVILKGRDVAGMTPDEVAEFGMVRSFQDVRIFARLSCLANVMLAVKRQPGEHLGALFLQPRRVARTERSTREMAMQWLEFVGMSSLAEVPAGALGFGQQKLVALARVLATDAEVLLLDEPASGIDHQWVEVMLGLIESLRVQGRTVCIVEHNLAVVGRLSDHIYFMELGHITAEGSLEELTGDRRLAEAYFGTA